MQASGSDEKIFEIIYFGVQRYLCIETEAKNSSV